MRTFRVPFTVSLMGVAEMDAETYEDAAASTRKAVRLLATPLGVQVEAMNVETADEEPKSEDDDA